MNISHDSVHFGRILWGSASPVNRSPGFGGSVSLLEAGHRADVKKKRNIEGSYIHGRLVTNLFVSQSRNGYSTSMNHQQWQRGFRPANPLSYRGIAHGNPQTQDQQTPKVHPRVRPNPKHISPWNGCNHFKKRHGGACQPGGQGACAKSLHGSPWDHLARSGTRRGGRQ